MGTQKFSDEEIAGSARACLEGMEAISGDAAVDAGKTFLYSAADLAHARYLVDHPASARVRAHNWETDKDLELFVCAGMPPVGKGGRKGVRFPELSGRQVASYRSLVGRMASFNPGDMFEDIFEILEIEKLDPVLRKGEIDSWNTQFIAVDRKPATVPSLRAYLKPKPAAESFGWLDDDEDRAEAEEGKVIEGFVRKERIAFGLQRIIVSREQDEIYSRPIDSRIILLGAAGTGKTTTMAQRLRSKMYEEGRTEEEQELVASAREAGLGFEENWIIFTPSELLKQYVRNALDNEGLGRLESQMSTWEDFSLRLALSKLGFLRGRDNRGGLVLPPERGAGEGITAKALARPSVWLEAFSGYRDGLALEKIRERVKQVALSADPELSSIGEAIRFTAEKEEADFAGIFASVKDAEIRIEKRAGGLKEEIRRQLRECMEECARRIPGLEAKWTALLEEEKAKREAQGTRVGEDAAAQEGTDEFGQEETAEETETPAGKVNPSTELRLTLQRWSEGLASGKTPASPAFKARIEVIRAGLPAKEKALAIGRLSLERKSALWLRGAFRWYLLQSWRCYRSFRRADLKNASPDWYDRSSHKAGEICQAELDLLILLHLRTLRSLYANRRVRTQYREELASELGKCCRMMVFVDEATDFSPMQLAAMAALAHPYLNSFFACGDINQRLTEGGIRSEDELRWAVPGADICRLRTSYRQTRALHEIGQAFLGAGLASEDDSAVQEELASEGDLRPALGTWNYTLEGEAEWTVARIGEMLSYYEGSELPTVAVFVPTRSEVRPLAQILQASRAIQENSLRVQACEDGRAVGADFKIGVYPIEFVKGLEFEAVFFTGVDALAEDAPEHFGQYLYVGATRASRFLGVSCRASLPEPIAEFEDRFCEGWERQKA